MAERWEDEGREAMVNIQREEFSVRSGRIEGVMVHAADGVEPMVIQREGGWLPDAFTVM